MRPALKIRIDVCGRARLFERVGVAPQHLVDRGHLLQRRRDGALSLQGRRHVDGPELRADLPVSQARNVGLQLRLLAADVDPVEVVEHVLAHRPGQVVVPVEERRFLHQPACPLERGVRRRLRFGRRGHTDGHHARKQEDQEQRDTRHDIGLERHREVRPASTHADPVQGPS